MLNDCIISPRGSPNSNGYYITKFKRGGKTFLMHRVVWEQHKGPIPEGMFICHKCDNPACVNIEHLFMGTNSDNMKDMYSKGRGNDLTGENAPAVKLTWEKVRHIRKQLSLGKSEKQLAEEFQVHRSNINYIKNNKTWKEQEESVK